MLIQLFHVLTYTNNQLLDKFKRKDTIGEIRSRKQKKNNVITKDNTNNDPQITTQTSKDLVNTIKTGMNTGAAER
jgi:hypothetical protein